MSSLVTDVHISEAEKPIAERISRLLDQGAQLFVNDERDHPLEITGAVRSGITKLMHEVQADDPVFLLRRSQEISPEQAAQLLGVSRPLVYKLLDEGSLPFRQIGTHRKIAVGDVLKLQAKRDENSATMTQMYEFFDGLEHISPR
jgi:excisionase family DNA binding protein